VGRVVVQDLHWAGRAGRLDGTPIQDHAKKETCNEGASYLRSCYSSRNSFSATRKFKF
jgi:hypothetical protein